MQSARTESEKPQTLAWLADLKSDEIIDLPTIIPVDAFGIGSDRAKIFFWRHERLHLPARVFDGQGAGRSVQVWYWS